MLVAKLPPNLFNVITPHQTWGLNAETLKKKALSETTVIWVLVHRDITGNSLADELATYVVSVPLSTAKLRLKLAFTKTTNTRWLFEET